MKKGIYISMFMALLVAVAFSCKSHEPKEPRPTIDPAMTNFCAQTECGAYHIDTPIFVLDKSTCQLSLSADRHTFRLSKDDLSQYFSLTLSEAPILDREIEGLLFSYDLPNLTSGTLSLTVLKLNNNYAWLWSDESQQGFIIRIH